MFYKHKEQGFILYLTLFFLVIFSTLSVRVYQSSYSLVKTNIQELLSDKIKLESQSLLRQIGSHIQSFQQNCSFSLMTDKALSETSIHFWKQLRCNKSRANFNYYFFIENLGINDCATINNLATQYYRLNLMIVAKGLLKTNQLFQATFAVKSPVVSQCKKNIDTLDEGLQSLKTIDWEGE
ncbi:MAG: hypothetical protein H0W64_02990 [Gammaproteobacteria bacterium]|nr:hypothetical protein [Gammaproteobacteria bacterium]